MDYKWLSDKIDNVDRLLMAIAGIFFVVFVITTILVL